MALSDQKAQPKKITVDGQSVELRSMEEIRQAQQDETNDTIKSTKALPIRCFKWSFPGSVK